MCNLGATKATWIVFFFFFLYFVLLYFCILCVLLNFCIWPTIHNYVRVGCDRRRMNCRPFFKVETTASRCRQSCNRNIHRSIFFTLATSKIQNIGCISATIFHFKFRGTLWVPTYITTSGCMLSTTLVEEESIGPQAQEKLFGWKCPCAPQFSCVKRRGWG